LLSIGVYQIQYNLCIKTNSSIVIAIEDPITTIITEIPYTLITKTSNDSFITGNFLIQTTNPNSVLTIRNPLNQPNPLPINVILSENGVDNQNTNCNLTIIKFV
jgi:hypothetical protein